VAARWVPRSPLLGDASIAVLVPAAAAMFGLVLEDILPVRGLDGVASPTRLVVLGVLVAVLVGAVAYRRWVYRTTGTLYSVSFLDERMGDYHENALADARRRHMALQVLGRRIDLAGRECSGVADVITPRQELSRMVEDAFNQDRDDTGYVVAPNLLWPAALAVGPSLTRARDARFIEFDKSGEVDQIFMLHERADNPVAAPTRQTTALDEPTGDRRGVVLAFTEAFAKFTPERQFARLGVQEFTVLRPLDGKPGQRWSGPALCRLADDLAGHLATLKSECEHGNRELVVVAFLPKTVALLIGWHLGRARQRFFANTHLMHYVLGEDRFVALRVHPSQPTHFPSPVSGS